MKVINHGLNVLPKDERDYSLAGFFGQISPDMIPNTDFEVSTPLCIKDQGETDFCSAYAVTAVSEDQEGIELLPEYNFYKTKLLSGDPDTWGADLRTACKVAVQFGSLPAQYKPMEPMSRDAVVNRTSWLPHFDDVAYNFKKATYFAVDGSYDTFDNIRAAMWGNRDEKRSIVVGALWRQSWITAHQGIIPKVYEDGGFGHAFKIFGQKVINGELYLKAQLSNGTEIGDNGIFYFPREVVNKEFTPYGQFMFKDVERKTVESVINPPWYSNFIRIIANYLHL